MRKTALFLVLCSLFVQEAMAGDLNNLGSLSQSEFVYLVEDLGAALSYKALTPAEPLGITGFDIGVEVTATELQHADVVDKATAGDGFSTLLVPKLHLHKGLPANLDVGLMYAATPSSNVRLWGGELRYAFIEGSTVMPAVALRATYSVMRGVEQLDLKNKGAELTVSKGFAILTPYAGVGNIWTFSNPDAITGLADEDVTMAKYFAGANVNLGLMNMDFEVDKTGDALSYGAKLGWRF